MEITNNMNSDVEYPWLGKRVPSRYWKSIENQCKYINWLGNKLRYKKTEDWYKVKHSDFRKNGGAGLLVNYYNDSPYLTLKSLIPEYDWKPWLFGQTHFGFWEKPENQRKYMIWLGEKLGYVKPEDWYKISKDYFVRYNGYGLLNYYSGSAVRTVQSIFPEYNLEIHFFKCLPINYWKSEENQKKFLERLGKKLGFTKPEDWYEITKEDFNHNRGGGFLAQCCNNSPSIAAKKLFPDYDYKPWLFQKTSQKFWKKSENQKKYFAYLGKRLGYKKPSDWYKVSQSDFVKNNGYGLLMQYKKSPIKIVQSLISGYEFKPWLFKNVALNFWSYKKNRKEYMDWLGEKLGYIRPEDWYQVTNNTFIKNHGGTFLGYFNDSAHRAVKEIFPNYDFDLWLFRHVPPDYWNDMKNQRNYLDWLGDKLGYTRYEDWYKVTTTSFRKNRGDGLLVHHYGGSPALALQTILSDYKWQPEKFSISRKRQKSIYSIVKKYFPNDKVEWNYKHSELLYKRSKKKMELDIYLPSKSLAIEYQGEQHFIPLEHFGGKERLIELQRRDKEKTEACKDNGISLIEIDYTWDGRKDSLIHIINKVLKSRKS